MRLTLKYHYNKKDINGYHISKININDYHEIMDKYGVLYGELLELVEDSYAGVYDLNSMCRVSHIIENIKDCGEYLEIKIKLLGTRYGKSTKIFKPFDDLKIKPRVLGYVDKEKGEIVVEKLLTFDIGHKDYFINNVVKSLNDLKLEEVEQLELKLKKCIEKEDYEKAKEIKEEINKLKN
jgi:hypothetical protein